MGNLVSVWSTAKKQGKTVFLYYLARHLTSIIGKDLRVLCICINLGHGNLLNLFGVDKEELCLEDIINFKTCDASTFNFNIKRAVAKHVNLSFLGCRMTNINYASRNLKTYSNLIEELKDEFDLVLVDTISGDENPLTNMFLDKSDHILNVLTQDKETLDKSDFKTEKDLAYIVNFYRDIYPNEKDLRSIYKINDVFLLPFCNDLQEMKNKNKHDLYAQYETEYNIGIKEIANFIAEKLKLDMCESADTGKKKGIFSGILGGV